MKESEQNLVSVCEGAVVRAMSLFLGCRPWPQARSSAEPNCVAGEEVPSPEPVAINLEGQRADPWRTGEVVNVEGEGG